MMALAMIVTLSQCRKPDVETEDNEENTSKVRISCTIPINKDSRTDFTNILENGTVNWSAGVESIYLAIHHETNPQIVELTSEPQGESKPTLTFTGSIQLGLLEDGEIYDVWYLGNSKHTGISYIEENIENNVMTSINGAISAQSGSLSDLGKCHIAKATVTAIVGDGGATTLNFNGNFKNQIAIVRLGDESASTNILRGNAIIGTDYSLQYDGEKFELAVTESAYANISVAPQTEDESYVVVFPNTNNNVELMSDSGKKVTFLNGVKAGGMYTVGWEEYEGSNGYEYVDLGLPSGLKWATFNVGANTPEAYGDYFAWGEIAPKTYYGENNSKTYEKEMGNISGNTTYDAATVNWGENWRIPTQGEMQELIDNCTWTWTQLNGVNGYNVTGTNGKSIFLPAAGSYNSGGGVYINERGSYWTSTPTTIDENRKAYYLVFLSINKIVGSDYRDNGRSIRPVSGRKFDIAEVTTAEVTSITDNSAVCGGYVTGNNAYVTEKGICWSTSENPTINDNKMACGQGEGEYTVTLTGLTSATVYYVRAYATNEAGTNYGSQVRFNTTMTGNNEYVYDFSNMGSHIVDLGLPSGVLWSDCNIGAEWAVEQTEWPVNIYGNYFMWACNTSSQYFGEGNYPDYAKAITINSESDYGYNYSGDIRYDAATNLWGGNWRTPTAADIDELKEHCTPHLLTITGKDGIEIECLKFTSKLNGKSIYFPLGGVYYDSSELDHRNDLGYYLTANIYNRTSCRDWILRTESDCHRGWDLRWYGYSLRPVIGPIPAED